MNKITSTLLAAALLCATTLAYADHDKDHASKHHDDYMSAMDTNGDGLISKDEFMNFHAAMWDKMPKNKDGLVAMKDMHHMHGMHDMHDMHGHHTHDGTTTKDKDERKDD